MLNVVLRENRRKKTAILLPRGTVIHLCMNVIYLHKLAGSVLFPSLVSGITAECEELDGHSVQPASISPPWSPLSVSLANPQQVELPISASYLFA